MPTHSNSDSPLVLWTVVAAVSAGLLVFSQTLAWWGDEGSYLLAARLINAGQLPYRDFFYHQVPLYAYLNAGWLRALGDSWRSAHLLSVLATSGAIILVAGFVFARVPDFAWRLPIALTAVVFVGLHALTIQFGTVAMPYALCLLFIVAAFRLVIKTAETGKGWPAVWAGLCAGASAATTLLAAPVVPIFCLWLARNAAPGGRRSTCAKFLAGTAIPFLPVLWLAAQAPRQALFNIIEFHLYYRRSSLEEALRNDLITFYKAWIGSPQGLLLILLAIAGLSFLARQTQWEARRRSEFYLCAWLAGGLGAYLAGTLPAWDQYFMLLIPFIGILAALGVYAIGCRLGGAPKPGWLMVLLIGIFTVGLAKPADDFFKEYAGWWQFHDQTALEVNRVTPRDGLLWADDFTYVAAGRLPPPGTEIHAYTFINPSFLRRLPAELVSTLHIVPAVQLDEWLSSGRFDTVVIGSDDPKVEELGLARLYAGHTKMDGNVIFWDRTEKLGLQ